MAKRATVKGKVSSAVSKISKRADMLGALVGYFGTMDNLAKHWGGTEGLGDIVNIHINAVTKHNIAAFNFDDYQADLLTHGMVAPGVALMLGGAALKYVPSVVPNQATIGTAAAKAGFGVLVGSIVSTLVGRLAQGSSPLSGGMGTTTQSQNRPPGVGQGANYPRSRLNLGGPGYPHSWSAPDGYRATLKTESIMP